MNSKRWLVAMLAVAISVTTVAVAKEKKKTPRAMIESMQAIPCGAKQKGVNGLGSLWASIGVTSMSSNEKLCPQYLLRTDQLEYHIRPEDTKHPVVLPIGQEAEFKIKKDRMYLKVADGKNKTREYQVVSMQPTKAASEESAYHPAYDPAANRPVTPAPVTAPNDQLPQRAVNQPPTATPAPPQQ
jgi:hypothetical protein